MVKVIPVMSEMTYYPFFQRSKTIFKLAKFHVVISSSFFHAPLQVRLRRPQPRVGTGSEDFNVFSARLIDDVVEPALVHLHAHSAKGLLDVMGTGKALPLNIISR